MIKTGYCFIRYSSGQVEENKRLQIELHAKIEELEKYVSFFMLHIRSLYFDHES